MDTKLKVLFIICCIIGIITVIFASLISSVLYKREQYLKNPYYFCDATWECCKTEAGCDAAKGLEDIKASGLNTYYVSDIFTEGSPYHQNCILPVMNYVNNYDGSTGIDLSALYDGSSAPSSFVYGKGCTGPGGVGKCADPTYNPQTQPLCQYHSFDAPIANWPSNFEGNTGLAAGTKDPMTTTSMNYQYWFSTNPTVLPNSDLYPIQQSNGSYTQSWNTTTNKSSSGFTVPLQNPNINSSTNTFCFNRYNVLRPTAFTNSGYITNCTPGSAP